MKQMTVRDIPDATYDQIRNIAVMEHRSANAQVLEFLLYGIAMWHSGSFHRYQATELSTAERKRKTGSDQGEATKPDLAESPTEEL
jgi:hypothetical protein